MLIQFLYVDVLQQHKGKSFPWFIRIGIVNNNKMKYTCLGADMACLSNSCMLRFCSISALRQGGGLAANSGESSLEELLSVCTLTSICFGTHHSLMKWFNWQSRIGYLLDVFQKEIRQYCEARINGHTWVTFHCDIFCVAGYRFASQLCLLVKVFYWIFIWKYQNSTIMFWWE